MNKLRTRPADVNRFDQPICAQVLRQRYAQPGERSVADIQHRVARALASVEPSAVRLAWQGKFLAALKGGFIPGGRIQASAGTSLDASLINCFVQPVAPQSAGRDPSGRPGLELALKEASRTMRMGGGVGFNLGTLPPARHVPQGPRLDPVSVILRLEERGRALAAVGARRAAQMAVLDISHPDAEAIIELKRHHALHTINLSVSLPDAFMEALDRGDRRCRLTVPMPGDASSTIIDPVHLWHRLLRAAWDTGSPGVVFIDTVNRDNNLSGFETLHACNPCAEQFLPDYGACDLGSIDLTRVISLPFTLHASIDFNALNALVFTAVRALDNVIDLTRWPLAQQAEEALRTRRVGLGITGLADALCMLGLRYDRHPGRMAAATIVRTIRNGAYLASSRLALERGAFPLFDAGHVLAPPHAASRLPAWLRRRIERDGLRNSHLLAIAPTGSISIAFGGNVSSGIEPAFAPLIARGLAGSARQPMLAEDFAWRLYRLRFRHRREPPPAWCDVSTIAPVDHIRMVAAIQPFVDSAISKTVNLNQESRVAQLDGLLRTAWRSGLKGVSVFRPAANARAVCPVDR